MTMRRVLIAVAIGVILTGVVIAALFLVSQVTSVSPTAAEVAYQRSSHACLEMGNAAAERGTDVERGRLAVLMQCAHLFPGTIDVQDIIEQQSRVLLQ